MHHCFHPFLPFSPSPLPFLKILPCPTNSQVDSLFLYLCIHKYTHIYTHNLLSPFLSFVPHINNIIFCTLHGHNFLLFPCLSLGYCNRIQQTGCIKQHLFSHQALEDLACDEGPVSASCIAFLAVTSQTEGWGAPIPPSPPRGPRP